ncbi:hypothetical protein ACH5RR_022593 [Cinchona calisaya]|uniref:Uncharacterized protein n=1 Tax=Cinchona calisaya TaxID=153742 RepID=A0ABD2Z880_9GENT
MVVLLRDTESEDLLDYLDVCIDFIDQSIKYGPVLVHCMARVSRAFSFSGVYVVRNGIWISRKTWIVLLRNSSHEAYQVLSHLNFVIQNLNLNLLSIVERPESKSEAFYADYDTFETSGKYWIEVMFGIPNDMLASIPGSMKAAEKWCPEMFQSSKHSR